MDKQSPLLVAVCGGTSTGKSTMVSQPLAKTLGMEICTLIELDNFQKGRDSKQMYSAPFWYDNPDYFEVNECARAIDRLSKTGKTEFPVYDYKAGRQTGSKLMEARKVIIYEGLFAGHGMLGEMADMIIYVESFTYARLLRRMYRNMNERYKADPLAAFKNFFTTLHAHNQLISPQKLNASHIVHTSYYFDQTIQRFHLQKRETGYPKFDFSYHLNNNTSIGIYEKSGIPHFAISHQNNVYLDFGINDELAEKTRFIDFGSC